MLSFLLLLALAILLMTHCRSGHSGLPELRQYAYAHRGLHGNGRPENSMSAFKAALDAGFGIELDIHLLRDGNLAVIHDSLLNRTTGQSGHIEDLSTADLARYNLEGTSETIPEFMDVLTLFDGKAPIIVELKPENGNQAALAEAAVQMLKTYHGPYCLESFDPRCLSYLRKHHPHILRGQLTQNFLKHRNDLSPYLQFLLTHNLLNFLSSPDFIAYRFEDRKDSPLTLLCRKLWHVQMVTWTVTTPKDHRQALKDGFIPIFEGYVPGVKKLEQ